MIRTGQLRQVLRGHWVDVAWASFAAVNYAAMIAWPSWETIPFHFVWISLTLVYGFRVWSLQPTLVVLGAVVAMTGVSIGLDAFHDIQLWGELMEVPLMAAMFLAMVWHARRRVEALRIAEWRAEEGRSLLERQERFIHDASHELRTPVTIARGHLELLRVQAGKRPEIDVALDELGRMEAIVERLLLLAGADQPDFVRLTEVELEPLLEDIFMRWSELAPRAWRLGPLAPGRLLIDAERLRAALDALLENAVKYSRPHAAIELRARTLGPGEVSIEVEDEGFGVAPEALARIFDRFGRADSARTRSAGGVGLGLAIADAIARAHGGSCTVTSTEAGSIFALELPSFAPAPEPRAVPALADGAVVPPLPRRWPEIRQSAALPESAESAPHAADVCGDLERPTWAAT
ncbi:MAG: HAMP domain-containing sensor histidine kinase [Solirubrobacteraceae bacterium]